MDMRNHGDKSANGDQQLCGHGRGSFRSDGSRHADILGHSMGGKAVMTLALTQPSKAAPDRCRRHSAGRIWTYAATLDRRHAVQIDLASVETRRDADQQLAKAVDEPGVRAFLLQSLDVKARQWRMNLDVLEAEMDKIIGFPEMDGTFDGPALFLSGGRQRLCAARASRRASSPCFQRHVSPKLPGRRVTGSMLTSRASSKPRFGFFSTPEIFRGTISARFARLVHVVALMDACCVQFPKRAYKTGGSFP